MSDSPVVLVEHSIIRTLSVDTRLLLQQIQSSYMFRLHKTAIIRPYVSENVKRKVHSCIIFLQYNFLFYIF